MQHPHLRNTGALAHFVAEDVLQVVVEQLEVELERAVQPEHGVVVQRREVLDQLRGRVGVGTLREPDVVGSAHHVPEQVVRVLDQRLVLADEVVVDGARPAQPVDRGPVLVEHRVPGVGHERGELGERHVVAVPQRPFGGVGPVPPDDPPAEPRLEVPGAVLVPLLQLVPIRGQQPLERVPDEQELCVRGQHVGRPGRRIVAQPVQRAGLVHHVRRNLRQVRRAARPRVPGQHHEHPFPVGASHLWDNRTSTVKYCDDNRMSPPLPHQIKKRYFLKCNVYDLLCTYILSSTILCKFTAPYV